MADTPFADIEELQNRLDFTMDANERRLGQAALEDLSDEARHFGSLGWTGPNVAPRVVRTWVLKAAYRYMKNIEGYVQSRAGAESVSWPELTEIMGTASFTDQEIRRLRDLARPPALVNAATYVYGRGDSRDAGDYWASVDYHGRKFPLIAKGDRWR